MRLLKEEDIIEAVNKHTNGDNALDNDISCILEEVPDAPNNNTNWISTEDKLPVVVKIEEHPTIFSSNPVLVQTKKGDMFVAVRQVVMWKSRAYKDEDNWYSYGTGGRKMKVKNKVIAWMSLPEPYVE